MGAKLCQIFNVFDADGTAFESVSVTESRAHDTFFTSARILSLPPASRRSSMHLRNQDIARERLKTWSPLTAISRDMACSDELPSEDEALCSSPADWSSSPLSPLSARRRVHRGFRKKTVTVDPIAVHALGSDADDDEVLSCASTLDLHLLGSPISRRQDGSPVQRAR